MRVTLLTLLLLAATCAHGERLPALPLALARAQAAAEGSRSLPTPTPRCSHNKPCAASHLLHRLPRPARLHRLRLRIRGCHRRRLRPTRWVDRRPPRSPHSSVAAPPAFVLSLLLLLNLSPAAQAFAEAAASASASGSDASASALANAVAGASSGGFGASAQAAASAWAQAAAQGKAAPASLVVVEV